MKVSVLSFSGRKGGNCSAIAQEAARHYQAETVALYDFSTFSIAPCGG